MQTRVEINHWIFKIGLTTKLHLCCTASCPVVFHISHGNSHDATEGRKLIKFIYPKNNNYLSMDRAYEDGKIFAMDKSHSFSTVVSPKKIISPLDYTINKFINNEILSNNLSFD